MSENNTQSPTKQPTTTNKRPPRRDVSMISIDKIVAKEGYNVRIIYGDISGFEKTIRNNPAKLPPLVGHVEKGLFYITDGFRRHLAAQNVQAQTGQSISLPVIKEPRGYAEIERLTDMFLYNEGKPLTLLEQARGVRRFKEEHKLQNKDIAHRINKSITYVRNCILLLQSPEETQEYISNGYIKESLVIKLLKEYGIDEAARIIHDTIEGALPNSRQLQFNMAIADEPTDEELAAPASTNDGVTPKIGADDGNEFHETGAIDFIPDDPTQMVGSAVNASGFKTDAELGIGGKDDDFRSSDNGEQIKSLPVRRVTQKDVDLIVGRFDSLGAFKRIWGEHEQKGYVKNPAYYEEFVFIQRLIEGAVSVKEMMLRYFKYTEKELTEEDLSF